MSKLTAIFAFVLNIDEASITSELSPDNTAAWDSLNAIVLVTEIEKAFNVKFAYDEVMEIKNFDDITKLLVAKGVGEV